MAQIAQLDHRLLADIPRAAQRGYLAAQGADLATQRLELARQAQGSLADYRQKSLDVTRQGITSRESTAGLRATATAAQRTVTNEQRNREIGIKEVNSFVSSQKAATDQFIKAKDQAGLDKSIASGKALAARSSNPQVRALGEAIVGVKLGKNGEPNVSTVRMKSEVAKAKFGITDYAPGTYVEVELISGTQTVLKSKQIAAPKTAKVKSSVHTRKNPIDGTTEIVRVYEDGKQVVASIGVDLSTVASTRKAINQGLALINRIESGSELDQLATAMLAKIGIQKSTIDAADKKAMVAEIRENVNEFKKLLKNMEKAGAGRAGQLPPGVTEADITFTMQQHGLTREQVLERLGQ